MFKKIILTLLMFFMYIPVFAETCPNDEYKKLNIQANRIKMNYEVIDKSSKKDISIKGKKTSYSIPNYNFNISIYNMTKDLKILMKDNFTETTTIITYDMTNDGIYTFINDDFSNIYHYSFEIYSNTNTCNNKLLSRNKIIKPKYNPYSEYTFCKNSTILYCQKFVNQNLNIKNDQDFYNKIKVNNEANNPNANNENNNSIINLVKNNWKMYLIIFVLIILITISLIIYIKKRNKKSGWKL